jgi:hypothetical protein
MILVCTDVQGSTALAALGDRRGAAGATAHLGCLALDSGDPAAALRQLEEADATYTHIEEVRLRAAFLPFLGACRAVLGDRAGAEAAFELAAKLARSVEAPAPVRAASVLQGLLVDGVAPDEPVDVQLAANTLRLWAVRLGG